MHKDNQVHFLGHGPDFTQEIAILQIEHATIETAQKGQETAVRVIKLGKQHTSVFLFTEE